MKNIADDKKFWKTTKPLFSNKQKTIVWFTLKEIKEIVENQIEVANILIVYFTFSNLVSLIKVPESNNINSHRF